MIRSNRVKIVFILVLFLGVFVFNQDKQVKEDKQLREDILAAYKAGGKQGLLDFVKKKKDKTSNKFILDFAKAGMKERKGEWLKISLLLAKEQKDEKILADVLYQTGRYFRSISDNKKAADYFDKALAIYIKLNEPVGQGNVYLMKGAIYSVTGENSRALEMFDKALPFFEKAGQLLGQGNVYRCKGKIYLHVGDNSRALEMYDKAQPFFEKAGDPIGQGNVYVGKGTIYLIIGEKSSALEMYDKALPFFEKAGEPVGQGNVYRMKGVIYSGIGDKSRALEMYDKALPFYEKVGELIGQGNVYMNKGGIYLLLGENSRALEMFDKALPFFEKAGQPIGQGNVNVGKGDIYLRIGEKSRALKMYDKALPFYEKAGDPIGQGDVYNSKGGIYSGIGENSRALVMYDKALPFFEKAGDPIGQGHVYRNKGEIYMKFGNNSSAFEMYEKALQFYEKAGEPIGQGNVYHSKGDIYSRIGENSRAFEMYDKALPFYEKAEEPVGQGHVYLSKGKIYSKNDKNSSALEMFDKALSFYKKPGDIKSESNALHEKAKVLVKLGKKEKALDLFEKAIANLEKVRTKTVFSDMKRSFLEKSYDQYEETVLFMLENKYYNRGFKYSESMRARVFLDQMAEGLVRLDKGLTPDLKQKLDNLVTKLSLLSKEIHKTDWNKEKKKFRELKEQYLKTEREFEDLLVKIRQENPLYASVRYPEPVSVNNLQKGVLKKGEILVRYFISLDKSYVFLVSKKRFKVVPLAVKAEKIRSYVNRFLLAVKGNSSGDMEIYGKILYRELFKPLEAKLIGKRDIIIIPDSHLEKIPFDSFIIGEEKSGRHIFLLEKYRLKYIRSASFLSILRKHYRRDRKTKRFIGFGDPVYDYGNFKQGKMEQGTHLRSSEKDNEIKEMFRSRFARVGGIMNRLQDSGEEIKTIVRLFEKKSQKSVMRLREQATEDNARKLDVKDFDYIHFACHGLLNDDFQSLVLSQDIPGAKDDGYFTLNEIMNCDYNAKLVVLSACQTGSGKMERGEGVTGLTRAVMYAGTPAVIASLWDVDDRATKELMVTFYKNLLEKNLNKTEALRQAKLEMIKNKKYISPLFWSAFVMYGE